MIRVFEIINNSVIVKNKEINMGIKRLYDESIILIGPSGAGKSTVAEELTKIIHLPRLCLDSISNNDRRSGFKRFFRNADEYNAFLIKTQIERAEKFGLPGVVDFGAGHSVYDDKEIFGDVKKRLSKFKNIVLLLPTEDLEKSLKILASRSTGDYSTNRKFITSSCNRELATIIVYENGKKPSEIATEIVRIIDSRNKDNERER